MARRKSHPAKRVGFLRFGERFESMVSRKNAEGEAMSQLSDIRSKNISGVNEKETAARVSAFTKSAAVGGGRSRRWSAAGTTSSILERRYPTDGWGFA